MFTRSFWMQTFERCAKSFCQSVLVGMGAGAVGLLDIGWQQVLSLAASYTLASLLTSIVSSGVGPDDGPSLVSTKPATE